MLLYKNALYEESGEYKLALDHLAACESQVRLLFRPS